MNARVLTLACFVLWVFVPVTAQAQGDGVTFERILNAESEPQNWLTYSGGYDSQRHTVLDQIDAGNVDELELKWVYQAESLEVFQTSPIVVDGIMYLTEAPNTVVALDAKLGRVFWRYEYTPSNLSRPCCGRVNRGLGILGHTLYVSDRGPEYGGCTRREAGARVLALRVHDRRICRGRAVDGSTVDSAFSDDTL